jgi:hypothetical protein
LRASGQVNVLRDAPIGIDVEEFSIKSLADDRRAPPSGAKPPVAHGLAEVMAHEPSGLAADYIVA